MYADASVETSGRIENREVRIPASNPKASTTTNDNATPAKFPLTSEMAAIVAPSPMAEPTEISIPPVAITSVKPSPTSATFVACVKMLENVSQATKLLVKRQLNRRKARSAIADACFVKEARCKWRRANLRSNKPATSVLSIQLPVVGDRPHNALLVDVITQKLSNGSAITQDNNPVTIPYQLTQFR
jgi:hypothetical protein